VALHFKRKERPAAPSPPKLPQLPPFAVNLLLL
jgi:hypothetical protein